MEFRNGQSFGPYELVSPLGAGGMGEVWKARDTRLDRTVALKFSHAAFSDRAQREAQAIAALNHPNIATLYDVGPDYLVMEYVEGAPVTPTEDIRKILDLATQIADGLAAAHAAGIVHRDLKPDNILVTKAGRVKILDFGLAKQQAATADGASAATMTQPGTVMGTAAYMSPEQARGQELDARSDQFSFGLILYEMATGKRAFERPSAVETMTAIIREEPEPLPDRVPTLLRWTVERLLSKEPERRYASTRDLWAELQPMAGRVSEVSAAQSRIPERRHAPRRAIFAIATLAMAAAAAVLAALGSRPAAAPEFRFTPFAAESLDEDTPAWSPDGRMIAYRTRLGRQLALMVKNADGASAPVTLVRSTSVDNLNWSADGERIYYQANVNDREVGIFSVARAGGDPVRLPFDRKRRLRYPALSLDGKTLAMLGSAGEHNPGASRIWISSPPGAEPVAIGPELEGGRSQLAWSPDGSQLLARMQSQTDDRSLWLVRVKGGAKRLLPAPFAMSPTFSWLADNRHVVIAQLHPAYSGADTGLFLLDTESEALSPFLPASNLLTAPAVSPDGKRIAYVNGDAGLALSRIPVDGGPPTPFMPVHVEQHSIAWSPNRKEFVLVRSRGLILRNVDGSLERVLASPQDFPRASGGAPFLTGPEFSPDGQRVVFSCSGCEPEGSSIWSAQLSGGTPARLTRPGEGGTTPSWSPDGRWIVYSRMGANGALYKIRIGSGEAPVRIREPWCPLAAWSPSADEILCAGLTEAVLLSSDGKQTRSLGGGMVAAGWSRDGKRLYAIRSEAGVSRLYRLDRVSLKWQAVTEFPPSFFSAGFYGGVARLSPAPEDNAMDLTVLVRDGDIWILDGFEPPRTFWERLWPLKR